MRIGIVFSEAFSLWRFHRGLLEELLGHGCEVYVLCPPGECMDQIKSLGVVFLPVEMYRFLNPLKDLRSILRLYRLFRPYRFDIVHTFTIKQNIYGILAARIAGVRTVLSTVLGAGFFNTPVASPQVRGARFMIHVLLRISGRLVTRIWFVNPDDLQFFLRKGYVSPEKCVLVRSGGVSVMEYDPAAVPAGQRARTRQELALAPDDRLVLMLVGRFIWSKGIREFAGAADILARTMPNVKFLLAGAFHDGSPDSVPVSFFESKARTNFQMLPFRSEIRPLLAVADVFCLPSYYGEGVPTALLEAAAMGCPLVTTDNVGCREVVESGKNGYIVPVKDAPALARALQDVLSDERRRCEFGEYSRRKAEREFDEKLVNSQVWNRLYLAS